MRHLRFDIIAGSLFFLVFASCVSVNLKSNPPTKSEGYSFQAPSRDFVRLKGGHTDHAWQNQQTGNTIAVLSECSESRDPSLSTLESETVQAMNNTEILQTKESHFQGRASRRSVAQGSLDGIAVKMDILTFKKNACAYTLTYMGRSSVFESEKSAFEDFVKGFIVP